MADRDAIRQRAERALRIPDLEWARDVVHGLARDVLALLDETSTAPILAPSLTHAIGNGAGGRVQLRTCTLEPYAFVSCEHPDELLHAIRLSLGPGSWLECDDGRIIQLRHVVQMRVWNA